MTWREQAAEREKFNNVSMILIVNWMFFTDEARWQCGQVRRYGLGNPLSGIDCLTHRGVVGPNPNDLNWIQEADWHTDQSHCILAFHMPGRCSPWLTQRIARREELRIWITSPVNKVRAGLVWIAKCKERNVFSCYTVGHWSIFQCINLYEKMFYWIGNYTERRGRGKEEKVGGEDRSAKAFS